MNRETLVAGPGTWLSLLSLAHAAEPKSNPFFPFCINWHDAKKRSCEQQAVTLKTPGCKGPSGLQCYGIGGGAGEHLARSMAAWRKRNENLNH